MISTPISIGTLDLLSACVCKVCIILSVCVALLFLLILELGNQTISSLTALVSALVLNVLAVDDWHIFQSSDVIVLDHKHCTSDFDYVIYFERMKIAHFAFGT